MAKVDKRVDFLTALMTRNCDHIIFQILDNLSIVGLGSAAQVSKTWEDIVEKAVQKKSKLHQDCYKHFVEIFYGGKEL